LADVIGETGRLFGDLWHRYDDALFEESVALFARRFEANGFDLQWFRGKRCLDAGCGGGRYSVAMARLGAAQVVGIDISSEGISDCRIRARDLPNVSFEQGSVLDLRFPGESFDFVCASGVLHHTSNPRKGLSEITRVLRPGGCVFLLLYGARGLRWPTIMAVRPHAQAIGFAQMDRAMRIAGLPANKQRTFLDDLFVPLIAFYEWDEVRSMLEPEGYTKIERWERGKLDHEASVEVQRAELVQLADVFERGLRENVPGFASDAGPATKALDALTASLAKLDAASEDLQSGRISRDDLEDAVFGAGHHRVLAVKQ
jgi:ubiquinone/menaquinone biosynthesis C-methylase UbiE